MTLDNNNLWEVIFRERKVHKAFSWLVAQPQWSTPQHYTSVMLRLGRDSEFKAKVETFAGIREMSDETLSILFKELSVYIHHLREAHNAAHRKFLEKALDTPRASE